MNSNNTARKEILRQIKNGEVTADDGYKILISMMNPSATTSSTVDDDTGEARQVLSPNSMDETCESESVIDSNAEFQAHVEKKLREIVASEAKISVSRVKSTEPLERYGFDSVMVLSITRELEKEFGKLSPTLLFEHQTVAELASYFLDNHRDVVLRIIDVQASKPVSQSKSGQRSKRPHNQSTTGQERYNAPATKKPTLNPRVKESGDDIAIIGLSCRFPLADDLDTYWENLKSGKDCISEIPQSRWDYKKFFDSDKGIPGKSYSKWGGFLNDVDRFDASFFHISPREAERIDPQERLFLEEVWHAFEDAGLRREKLVKRPVGVYVGVMYSQYQLLQAEQALKENFISLGSSYASIANRISYFFDLHGPSMALDTMCSSSLTAIHLACEALRSGDVELAVAGGVNLSIHPNKYLDLSEGRYASSDGRCRSFGEGGDGYVPGEGVGAAVLKPLSRALADGDQVYAVIRGSTLNHGGKTNGYTVPNPKAQSELIETALSRAGVDPRHVSYIEAHGTGTSLGDPIEISALKEAFSKASSDKQFCAIGSVKSNIGHLESAAGIAGLAKVVLQMRNRQIVPSLHAETTNPHIDFKSSPFYVQHTLEAWEQPVVLENGEEKTVPRIAGISSFGAGGANAHLILEEFIPETVVADRHEVGRKHLILLSAKNEERLKVYAKRLADYIGRVSLDSDSEADFLASVAFTLQTGRTIFDERLAIWVSGRDELVDKLSAFSEGTVTDDILIGHKDQNNADLELVIGGESGESFLKGLVEAKDFEKLVKLWLQGINVEWELLGQASRPKKISLPGYPFEREPYWAALSVDSTVAFAPKLRALHPLIDKNVSTLDEQRFTTELSCTDLLLKDHCVDGKIMLPGAAMLEMARAAAGMSGLDDFVSIVDTVWEKPVVVLPEHAMQLSISLVPEDFGVEYSIWSKEGNGKREIHAHGKLVEQEQKAEASTGKIDLGSIFAACPEYVSSDQCYQIFEEFGLKYGPTFRTLEFLHCAQAQAIGKLRLHNISDNDADGLVINPALLDGALQTLIAFYLDKPRDVIQVPYAVERIELLGKIPNTCFAHCVARVSPDSAQKTPNVFDISIADEDGSVVARIHGLMIQPVSRVIQRPDSESTRPAEELILRPVWVSSELRDNKVYHPNQSLRCLLVFEEDNRLSTLLKNVTRKRGFYTHIISVNAGSDFTEHKNGDYEVVPGNAEHFSRLIDKLCADSQRPDAIVSAWSTIPDQDNKEVIQEKLEKGFYSMLALTQALMRSKPTLSVPLVFAHPSKFGTPHPAFAALGAFNKTVVAENPSMKFKTLEVESGASGAFRWDDVACDRLLVELLAQDQECVDIKFEGNDRLVREFEVFSDEKASYNSLIKQGGAYIITGGCGGLGRVLAEFLASRWQARLILSGRSNYGPEHEEFIDKLNKAGGQATYIQADCADSIGARRLVSEAKQQFGKLDGVLHLAGTLKDGFILHKQREEAEAVLSPKVWGVHCLNEATRNEPLDFFAIFSSATAVIGNTGQIDYAFANAYLDQFAAQREADRKAGTRSGKTISINWPLWQGGGMNVDEAAKVWIEENLGWLPLEKTQGLDIFERALASEDAQWAVFSGYRSKILETLGQREATVNEKYMNSTNGVEENGAEIDGEMYRGKLLEYLKKIVSTELKLNIKKLDHHTLFEHLGIESVMVMNITRDLENQFGTLPKTLFFEYKTLNDLAGYFLDKHLEKISELYGSKIEHKQVKGPGSQRVQPETESRDKQRFKKRRSKRGEKKPETRYGDDIAIVGLDGCYPMASNLDTFWSNLKQGTDCIVEVPADRWDHAKYFDPSQSESGKSYGKWGGFMDDIDKFDPLFFNISPREARLMDPQERLFLQTAWHTIEDAGYTRKALSQHEVGVFVGVMYSQYQLYGASDTMQDKGFVPASLSASIANRVSYVFDFHGPSLALDTMCSSSLTAIHLACASIRNGDCDIALTGGVNTTLHPNKYLQLSQGKFASTDGRCRSFGEGGDGYVPGEGVGALLLKSLSQAEIDGDHIYAVIRGSAINHGGRTNGYTVPDPVAQANVISRAFTRAGVEPTDISYIEAHGTGTSLGDPIEIAGLSRVFEETKTALPKQSCPIGSVKSNIGHLESAAGIAAITKVLLQMKHGTLVPSIHSDELNPNIDFKESPFSVQSKLEPWRRTVVDGVEQPRISAVSSFGAGGANAHVVLEEYISSSSVDEPVSNRNLVVLSAKTEEQLAIYAKRLADYVDPSLNMSVNDNALQEVDILQSISLAAAQILEVNALDMDADEELDNLGFDLITSTSLSEIIERNWSVELKPHRLMECRTLRAIARDVSSVYASSNKNAVKTLSAEVMSINLTNIAYTTQVGREAFEERLAIIVSDVVELAEKLRLYGGRQEDVDGIYRGSVTAESAPWKALLDGQEGEAYIQAVIKGGNYEKLASLWVSGVDIDWSVLYEDREVKRVSMPTYPFVKNRYWVPEDNRLSGVESSSQEAESKRLDWEKLANPSNIQTNANSESAVIPIDIVEIRQAFTALDDFGLGLLVAALQHMGVLRQEGEIYRNDDMADQLEIVPDHRQLWETMLELLETTHYIEKDAENIRSTHLVEEIAKRDWDDEKRKFLAAHPELKAHAELVWVCMKAFPKIARGEVAATEVMFPGSSMALVEGIYQGNSLADYLNDLVADTVKETVEERLKHSDSVRILEVGAGTGGTSTRIFDKLKPYASNVTYTYTDISVGFLQYGKKRYGVENKYIEFKQLDIERDLDGQGFEYGVYDLVVAANVLHATKHIRNSINKVANLLKGDGCLILNETTDFSAFATLTFGLLEGWWLSQDSEVRLKGSPLLSVEAWETLMKEDGFDRINVAGPLESQNRLGQNVLVALRGETTEVSRISNQPISIPISSVTEVATPSTDKIVASEGIWERAKSAIVDAMSEVLEIGQSELDLDLPHLEFGVDSVLAVAIVDKINSALDVELKPTEFFNFSTIRKLADHLVNEYLPSEPAFSSSGPANEEVSSLEDKPDVADETDAVEEKTLKDLLQQLERGEISAGELDRLIAFS